MAMVNGEQIKAAHHATQLAAGSVGDILSVSGPRAAVIAHQSSAFVSFLDG